MSVPAWGESVEATAWWIAYPANSRKHAYQMESELLGIHKPYLNKAGGQRVG